MALETIRPVTMLTGTPLAIAARTAARVSGPMTRSSPINVPSISSAISSMGRIGSGVVDVGTPR